MKIEQGREAVWKHAQEADLQDAIRKVAEVFGIADIAITTPGKLTYLHNPPHKFHRVGPPRVDAKTGRIIPDK